MLRPYPRLLVLGAGLDAEPLVNFAEELGWRVTVVDHRQAYIDKGNFARASDVICAPVARLAETIDLANFDAAVVMSHHLQSDEVYLRQLAQTNIPYLGLLGPLNRRTRILRAMGEAGDLINERLHGPAGINIGASGPASIALSIVAQIQEQQIRR